VVGPALSGLRIFAGYAGWSERQIVEEVREGSWYVVPSEAGDLFGPDPARLWMRVLRRQPGELAWVSTRPLDPTQN
jgi:putative transcriptional regulator